MRKTILAVIGVVVLIGAAGVSVAAEAPAAKDTKQTTASDNKEVVHMMKMRGLSFTCGRKSCTCSGKADCDDLMGTGLCRIGPGTSCTGTECTCERKQ